MSGIVCAIRGGPGSRATIEEAIDLACKTGLPLYFLYVVNLDFLARTSSTRVRIISEQMRQMGEFILLNARAMAEAHGVQAEGLVRQGKVRQEIVTLCRKLNADYLVLGRPQAQQEANLFTEGLLQQFVQETAQQTGAQVIVVNEDGS